jgi:hypothetical protein
VISKPGFGSQWRCEQAGDREGVEQDQLIADFEALSRGFEPVAVKAGREQPGFALLIGLVDGERGLDPEPVIEDPRAGR